MDPHRVGGTECYKIDTSASWYSPEQCHGFDHHEWMHGELGRTRAALEKAEATRGLYTRAVELLREVWKADGNGGMLPPQLRAHVVTFLNGAGWYDAVREFMGDE